MSRTKRRDTAWTWPLDLKAFDREPKLSETEQATLDAFVARSARSRWQDEIRDRLPRLEIPVRTALNCVKTHSVTRTRVLRLLLTEMQQRRTCFWAWPEADWMQVFETARQPPYEVLQATVAVAYLLQGFAACHRVHFLHAVSVAQDVFGRAAFAQALAEVSAVLKAQHYSPFCASEAYLPLVLAFALLRRRSPCLHDLDEGLLKRLHTEALSQNHQSAFSRLSYALFALGIAAQPVDTVNREPTQPSSLTEGVDAEWALWCQRWLATSTLTQEVRKANYRQLMQVGRWLHSAHPNVHSPTAWTRELAAEFVAQVANLRTGQWTHRRGNLSSDSKPLAPRTKNMLLGVVRTFFRDCQRWEWIPMRFTPERDLCTPPPILRLLGPDPRTLEAATWAKLVWAGLNFTLEDLPPGKSRAGSTRVYPLTMIRAVALTWFVQWVPSQRDLPPAGWVCALAEPGRRGRRSRVSA